MADVVFHVEPLGRRGPHTWVVAGDVVISLTQEGQIPDDQWSAFVDDIRRGSTKRMLGLGIGTISVSSRQRRLLVPAMHDKRVAAVLGSSVARGIATALSWMGLTIRAFPWHDIQGAFDYLEPDEIDSEIGTKLVLELLERSGAPELETLVGTT